VKDRRVAARSTKPRRLTWSRGMRADNWFCMCPYSASEKGRYAASRVARLIPKKSLTNGAKLMLLLTKSLCHTPRALRPPRDRGSIGAADHCAPSPRTEPRMQAYGSLPLSPPSRCAAYNSQFRDAMPRIRLFSSIASLDCENWGTLISR